MQGKDADRTHMGEKDWQVVCYQCGKLFEAVRSDATFCSARCRVNHSREPQKLLNAIDQLESIRHQVLAIAEKYKHNSEIIKQLELLKNTVAAAEYIAEYTD